VEVGPEILSRDPCIHVEAKLSSHTKGTAVLREQGTHALLRDSKCVPATRFLQTQASDIVCMGDDVHRNISAVARQVCGMAMAWTGAARSP
jgi:hypothetical protein